jgi:hypothetical protein
MYHNCLVCGSPSDFYFEKEYKPYAGWPFGESFIARYHKCVNCGFTFSLTHQEMDRNTWQELNSSWHHAFESGALGENINQPPYANQALATKLLAVNGLIDLTNSLDYAAGYGTFASILRKYFSENIYRYDPFVTGQTDDYCIESIGSKRYSLVVNSAMFEHILCREDIDSVNNLVADDGVMMLHTQIRQEIPKDPSWFYLEPHVHTAFFTNRAMDILLEQWGYSCSVYSPEARVWYFFKNKHSMNEQLASAIGKINRELQREYFYFKAGFMDYWK